MKEVQANKAFMKSDQNDSDVFSLPPRKERAARENNGERLTRKENKELKKNPIFIHQFIIHLIMIIFILIIIGIPIYYNSVLP
ncbi:hypothetical protein [Halalkalibacillus halophilus]|uniref:hypothetical protein n=1 Tax=Halalkalibacillus halophilus TaxID=392827 RepID=UPI0004064222|nr:hypothetical protein [Halalkalibacillus halophilus]